MSVRNMFAVERKQVFYATECGGSNMQSICGGFLRHQICGDDSISEGLSVWSHVDKFKPFQQLESIRGGSWIASRCLVDYQLGCYQVELVTLSAPPISGLLLHRSCLYVSARPRCGVAHDRRFNVYAVHRIILPSTNARRHPAAGEKFVSKIALPAARVHGRGSSPAVFNRKRGSVGHP